MTGDDRIPCCVPFCRRSAKRDAGVSEIICGKHWRLADQDLRRRYNTEKKRIAPDLERDPETLPPAEVSRIIKDWRWLQTMWGEIKRQAIEKAMGV